ncbi:MAG: DUF3048 domain-containing protein [Patescibacteria group bacterium]|nr:DUF3048 domain-containing protein [Patescibacteria group bacterium]
MNNQSVFKNKLYYIISTFLGVYLLAAGISWLVFSFLKNEPNVSPVAKTSESNSKIDPSLPKTEQCPMNGQMFTAQERQIWEERRPIVAIIENHEDARPQSGIGSADIVYEAVAEGGITRFLAVMYCDVAYSGVKIGPIRSARVYFINWAAEYGENPLFVHVGGANNICRNCPGGVKPVGQVTKEVDAFKMLDKLGWRGSKRNAFDGGTSVGYPIMIRDVNRLGREVAWEHTFVGFTDKIYEESKARGFGAVGENGRAWDANFVMWKFSDNNPILQPKTDKISFSFWQNKPNYDVVWEYDAPSNSYKRFNGGVKHVDHETGEQISAQNLLIQFVKERGPVDNEGHMFYQNIGKGKGFLFQNGDVIDIVWEKANQFSRTRYYDKMGKEVFFVRGKIWIEAVPDGNKIEY